MIEIRKTPRLRFPQFSREWEKVQLGDVCKIQGGFAFKSELFQESGIPVIRISNISNSTNFLDLNNLVFYNEIPKEENYVIKKGELLIAMSGATTGKTSISNLETKSYLNQRVGLFKTKTKDIDYPYLIQFVFSSRFGSQLDSFLVAGAQPNISSKDIEKVIFPITSLSEQKKISEFLTSVDRRIELLEKKKSLLETYKKGVMKKIFSQEIRFKDDDGNDFPDWEEKFLSEITEINPKSKDLPDSFIYIDLESVDSGKLLFENRIFKNESPSRAQRYLLKNDILFQMVRPYQKNNFFFDREGEYVASTGYAQLRSDQVPKFLYQLIHTEKFVNKVLVRCTGSNYPSINSNDLKSISVLVPSKPEQEKISSFLSSIDYQIQLLDSQIEKSKTWKKGLLQQMFV